MTTDQQQPDSGERCQYGHLPPRDSCVYCERISLRAQLADTRRELFKMPMTYAGAESLPEMAQRAADEMAQRTLGLNEARAQLADIQRQWEDKNHESWVEEQDQIDQLCAERDEARAEVERLGVLDSVLKERRHHPDCPSVKHLRGDCGCWLASVQGVQLAAALAEVERLKEEAEMWEGHYRRVLTELAALKGDPHALAVLAAVTPKPTRADPSGPRRRPTIRPE